jgi:transcriptional regulator with XRE-family HTH domain
MTQYPSSNSLHETGNQLHVQCVRHFVVHTGRDALAEWEEAERKERGWSFGEIVRRSGGYIKSASTLTNLVGGHVAKVSEDTLRGLAKAFNFDPRVVYSIYYGASGKPLTNEDPLDEVKILFDGWDEASEEQRAQTMGAIRMIAAGFQQERRRNPKKPPDGGKDKGKK